MVTQNQTELPSGNERGTTIKLAICECIKIPFGIVVNILMLYCVWCCWWFAKKHISPHIPQLSFPSDIQSLLLTTMPLPSSSHRNTHDWHLSCEFNTQNTECGDCYGCPNNKHQIKWSRDAWSLYRSKHTNIYSYWKNKIEGNTN